MFFKSRSCFFKSKAACESFIDAFGEELYFSMVFDVSNSYECDYLLNYGDIREVQVFEVLGSRKEKFSDLEEDIVNRSVPVRCTNEREIDFFRQKLKSKDLISESLYFRFDFVCNLQSKVSSLAVKERELCEFSFNNGIRRIKERRKGGDEELCR